MDEFMEMLFKAAMQDAVKKGIEPSSAPTEPKKDDNVQEAKEIAKMNKILFDAHIEAGFTVEQATQIVAAYNI